MTTLVSAANHIFEDDNGQLVPEGHVVYAVLDRNGETKHVWDGANPDDVASMKAMFDAERKKGKTAYKVDRKGKRDGVMTEFDPDAEAVVFAPANRGG